MTASGFLAGLSLMNGHKGLRVTALNAPTLFHSRSAPIVREVVLNKRPFLRCIYHDEVAHCAHYLLQALS